MRPTQRRIYAVLAGLGLSLGAAGLASAASSSGSTSAAATAVATVDTTATATDDTTATSDTGDTSTEVADGPHTANGITEEELTGDTATSVEAAVVAAYPDATVDRMETDADGATYEAHITMADGSEATVKLDASFAITATETGRSGGHHGGHDGGPHTANGITEEELAGDTATSVEAAVVAAYPDATVDRMETDADGATYEAHITMADGSEATVKLDASFAITATETHDN